ncbi:MAG TPA: phosphoribulokinase [Candidatus Dormibacteraeota bacterium]
MALSEAPIFVGIGGDSGSGKSTLARAFYDLFGEERITTICLDDYHSLDRTERGLVKVTPLNPRANNFALMEEQLWALKRGEAIEKPIYDHSDGTFKDPELLEPNEVVIIQGLHPFLVPGVREAFDLKVWLDPEPELRLAWKLQRDVAKRGYNDGQVKAEIEARRPDAEKYIEPQRGHADLVVRFYQPRPEHRDMGHLNVRVVQRHTLPRLAFDQRLHDGEMVNLNLDAKDEDGRRADIIEIDGRIPADQAAKIEETVWAHARQLHTHLHRLRPEQIGAYDEPARTRHSDPLALTQLILAHRILSAQKSLLVRVNDRSLVAGNKHGETLMVQTGEAG